MDKIHVLGVIAGILGVLVGMFVLSMAYVFEGYQSEGEHQEWISRGFGTIAVSGIALLTSLIYEKKPKVLGAVTLVMAFAGLVMSGLFYVLPWILFTVGGILALKR